MSHNTAIEVVWTVVPTILVVFIFWIGLKGYLTLATPPGDAYTVDVEARQWSWSFYYPTAGVDSDELHVPPNVPIQLRMRSVDVLHAFFVPAFRVKNDIVPGKLSGLWFEATDPGRYQIFCAEYCGEKHSDMLSIVEVHPSREDFDEWLARAGSFPDAMPAAERGEILYKKKGCIQCHTLDGVESTGPTWKGLWIKEADRRQATRIPVLVDGDMKEIVRDEAYLEESMKNPAAKLARSKEGYVNRMSIIRLKPEEIIYLIEFIKSLGE
ncbi:MAG: cytochrome c oxidase subunit II [Planctomycetota bacterium]